MSLSADFLAFTLECEPRAQMRPRFSGNVAYKHKSQKSREAELDALLAGFRPKKPLAGPVCLEFAAFMPVPKSAGKKKREDMLAGRIAPTAKPDLDNLAKQLKDAMTRAGFWHDDRQVVLLLCLKKYAENPRWQVNVRELGAR